MDYATIGLIIVSLVGLLGGVLGPIIGYQRNKGKSDVAQTYHDLLLDETQRNAILWETNRIYRRGIEKLTVQLLGKGIQPCWTIPEVTDDGLSE
jgi:hypothetical protein